MTPAQQRAMIVYQTAIAHLRPGNSLAVNDSAARDRAMSLYCAARTSGLAPDDAAQQASLHSGIHARIITRIVNLNLGV